MLGEDFLAALIVNFTLFASSYTAYGQATVKEWNRFAMLPLAIFYYKIQLLIIGINRKALSRITK